MFYFNANWNNFPFKNDNKSHNAIQFFALFANKIFDPTVNQSIIGWKELIRLMSFAQEMLMNRHRIRVFPKSILKNLQNLQKNILAKGGFETAISCVRDQHMYRDFTRPIFLCCVDIFHKHREDSVLYHVNIKPLLVIAHLCYMN